MRIISMEVEGEVGRSLLETLIQLKETATKRSVDEVFCMFNGHKIHSNMSTDVAYMLVMGKTLADIEKEKEELRSIAKLIEKEFDDKKPQLIKDCLANSLGIIADDKLADWEKVLYNNITILYETLIIDAVLEVIKMLDVENAQFENVKKELKKQRHSGYSEQVIYKLLSDFSKRGKEFISSL